MAATRVAPFRQSLLQWFRRLLNMADFEREALLVFTFGVSSFILAALLSHNPFDPTSHTVVSPPQRITNICGKLGAELSGILYYYFGFGSLFVCLPPLALAVLYRRGVANPFSAQRLCGIFGLVLSLCIVLHVGLGRIQLNRFYLPSGGILGEEAARIGFGLFGETGLAILVATLILVSAITATQTTPLRMLLTAAKKYWQEFRANLDARTERLANTLTVSKPATPIAEPAPIPQPVAPVMKIFERDPPAILQPTFAPPSPKIEKTTKSVSVVAQDGAYTPPSDSLFQKNQAAGTVSPQMQREFESTAQTLIKTLADFGIEGQIEAYQPGPVVTVFEFEPKDGVKQSRVVGLIDDLALALRVDSILIQPVRGKRALGIQVPNKTRETVYLGDIVSDSAFRTNASPLTFAMGKSLDGQAVCADLTTMPHLLMAGATGSGKSVAINTLLCSIVMKSAPRDVRMLLVDPKMLELSVYEGIPHLLMPVITDPKRASLALHWAAHEMERRYRLMQEAGVRNIAGFNALAISGGLKKFENIEPKELPYIVLVIDELADLMMTAPKDVETSIQRLAQKARASGIHMVLATQRPSVDIITGVIKANLPCRVAFQVVSKHDSRTILDQQGAEKLLGKGDLLLQRPGLGRLERIQGAFITDDEVHKMVAEAKKNCKVSYDQEIMQWIEEEFSRSESADADISPFDDDPKWDEAISIAQQQGSISASFLQRQLKIGYNRAARIVENMAKQGLVGPPDGAKPRQWLGGR